MHHQFRRRHTIIYQNTNQLIVVDNDYNYQMASSISTTFENNGMSKMIGLTQKTHFMVDQRVIYIMMCVRNFLEIMKQSGVCF